MKKMRLSAALLILALIAAVFSGCARTESAEEAATASVEETAEAAAKSALSETAAVSEEADQPAGPATEPSVNAEPVASGNEIIDDSSQSTTISYPIGDGSDSVVLWISINQNDQLQSYYDLPILPQILEATGVGIDFIEISSSAATEQFQLMVASGDWPDSAQIGQYYNGGAAQAYVDDVILDLTPLLEKNAPDYMRIVNNLNEASKAGLLTTTDSGEKIYLGVSTINDVRWADNGLFARQDWMDALGYTVEDMETIDGFTEVLRAVYAEYGCDWTYYMSQNGMLTNCVAFDCGFPSLADNGMTGISQYLEEDGTVASSWISDGYRSYIEWLRDMFAEKIINNEFYATSMNPDQQTSMAGTGHMFIWGTVADRCGDVFNYLDEANAGMKLVPLGMIYADENKINNWGSEQTTVGSCNLCVFADSEHPETVLQYYNYFFTDEGIIAANYGIEGVSFNYDADGEPQFTELVTNNPEFPSPQAAMQYYTPDYIPYYNYSGKMHVTFDEIALRAVEVFTAASNYTSEKRTYPSAVTISTDAQSKINNMAVDVCSYGMEQILKFVTGAAELNDENWNSYVEGMYGLKLQEILDLYQDAYDAYLAEK